MGTSKGPAIGTTLCACGCNRPVTIYKYRQPRFILGHNHRLWLPPFVIEDRGYKTPCWIWKRQVNPQGYGLYKHRNAHRIFYELLVSEIPKSLQLDHLCRVRCCVNPSHVEPVTNRENTIRGMAAEINRARMLARTRCVNGHEYTPENTFIRKGTMKRECRTCMREQWKRHRASRLETK